MRWGDKIKIRGWLLAVIIVLMIWNIVWISVLGYINVIGYISFYKESTNYLPVTLTELDYNIENINESNPEYAGWYNPFWDQITLFNVSTNDIPFTVLHEVGHRVWYRGLNKTQRNAWITAWDNDSITDYGSTDVEEDFSETFACYHIPDNQPIRLEKNKVLIMRVGCKELIPATKLYLFQTLLDRS